MVLGMFSSVMARIDRGLCFWSLWPASRRAAKRRRGR